MSKKELEDLKKSLQKRNFYTTNDASWVFFWCLVAPFAIGFLFMYVTMVVTNQKNVELLFQEKIWFAIIVAMLTEVIFLFVYLLYNKTYRIKQSSCNLSFKKANISTALVCALIGVLAVFCFLGLIEGALGNFFNLIGVKTSSLSLPNDTIAWLFVNIFISALLPAVCEELVFRGIIYQGLKNSFSVKSSIMMTSVLFALMHQNIIQFVYPILLGIVFCLVYEKTNNLLYTIIIHFFNNLTTVITSYLFNTGALNISFASMPWWAYLVVAALAALGVLIFVFIYKFFFKNHQKEEIEKEGEVSSFGGIKIGKFPLILIVSVLLSVVMIVINAI